MNGNSRYLMEQLEWWKRNGKDIFKKTEVKIFENLMFRALKTLKCQNQLIDFGTCLQKLTIPYDYFIRVRRIPHLQIGIISLPKVGIKPIGHFIIIILGPTNWSKSTFQHILMICRHYSHIQILNTKRILNFSGVWVSVGLSLHVQFLCVFIGMRWNTTKQGFMLALSGQRIVAIQILKLYVVLIITKSSVVQ